MSKRPVIATMVSFVAFFTVAELQAGIFGFGGRGGGCANGNCHYSAPAYHTYQPHAVYQSSPAYSIAPASPGMGPGVPVQPAPPVAGANELVPPQPSATPSPSDVTAPMATSRPAGNAASAANANGTRGGGNVVERANSYPRYSAPVSVSRGRLLRRWAR